MKRNGARRWLLGLAIGLGAGLVGAEEAKAPPALTVLGQSYAAAELGNPAPNSDCQAFEPMAKAVMGPLFAAYADQAGLAVAEGEIKDYCRRRFADADEKEFAETWEQWQPRGVQWKARQEAVLRLSVWKLQKSLFEKFGGRVAPGAGAPPKAFDAMAAYLAEREEAGDFAIPDGQLRIRFWECLRTPKESLLPPEQGRVLIEEHPADRPKRLRTAP